MSESADSEAEGIVIAFPIIFVVPVGACLHQIKGVIEEHNERQREEEGEADGRAAEIDGA